MVLLQADLGGGAGALGGLLVVVMIVVVAVIALSQRRPAPLVSNLGTTAHSIPYSAEYRTGLIALLAGESLARSLDRTLDEINLAGRRVVFMVPDRWSLWRHLGVLLGTLLTLGLWSRAPGYLIVAEAR